MIAHHIMILIRSKYWGMFTVKKVVDIYLIIKWPYYFFFLPIIHALYNFASELLISYLKFQFYSYWERVWFLFLNSIIIHFLIIFWIILYMILRSTICSLDYIAYLHTLQKISFVRMIFCRNQASLYHSRL